MKDTDMILTFISALIVFALVGVIVHVTLAQLPDTGQGSSKSSIVTQDNLSGDTNEYKVTGNFCGTYNKAFNRRLRIDEEITKAVLVIRNKKDSSKRVSIAFTHDKNPSNTKTINYLTEFLNKRTCFDVIYIELYSMPVSIR